MSTWVRIASVTATVSALMFGVTASAGAAPLILNGGFESGFANWTIVDQLGSEGTFHLQSGIASPLNGDVVPAPAEGSFAAMTDAFGPGAHVLYQDFVVPAALSTATLSYSVFVANRSGVDFFSPATLDFATPDLNQQARVDIMLVGADPFSLAPADVLLNVYQTQAGDPLIAGYTALSTDLTALLAAHLGQTLRLRFAETDNVFTFQFGVDGVAIETDPKPPVPEPLSIVLLATGVAAYGVRRRRQMCSRHGIGGRG